MKWLEIIVLRTAGNREPVGHHLEEIAGSLSASGLTQGILYKNAGFAGDFALILNWDTKELRPWGSDLALSLKEVLKQKGLVDHSVWITGEKEKRQNERKEDKDL